MYVFEQKKSFFFFFFPNSKLASACTCGVTERVDLSDCHRAKLPGR